MAEGDIKRIIVIEREAAPKTEAAGASACMTKFKKKGTDEFKGPKPFDSCVEAFKKCRTDVKDPEGMCAAIGRKAGKIP